MGHAAFKSDRADGAPPPVSVRMYRRGPCVKSVEISIFTSFKFGGKKGERERVNDPNSQQINMHIQNIEARNKVTGHEEADARVEDRDDVDVHIWLKQRLAATKKKLTSHPTLRSLENHFFCWTACLPPARGGDSSFFGRCRR